MNVAEKKSIDDFLLNIPTTSDYDMKNILNDTQEFKYKIQQCLNLLKNKVPNYYALLSYYNPKIIESPDTQTSAYAWYNSIVIASPTFSKPIEWLASVLIHEIIHFWQYHSGIKYSQQQQEELEANKYQLDVLQKINGSDKDIKHMKKQRGTHYSWDGKW